MINKVNIPIIVRGQHVEVALSGFRNLVIHERNLYLAFSTHELSRSLRVALLMFGHEGMSVSLVYPRALSRGVPLHP